jgi:hypothetical protein
MYSLPFSLEKNCTEFVVITASAYCPSAFTCPNTGNLISFKVSALNMAIRVSLKLGIPLKNGVEMPTTFEYERFEISAPTRYWWTNGFDPKWYLSPFPQTEVNKGYGLIQNPGW